MTKAAKAGPTFGCFQSLWLEKRKWTRGCPLSEVKEAEKETAAANEAESEAASARKQSIFLT